MIRHDKDLYQHNQDFMEGKKSCFIAHVWLESGNSKDKNCRDVWSYHWEDLVWNRPFFFYKVHHDQKIV